MHPPVDRVSVLIRLGLAVCCGAAAVTPWIGDAPTNFDRLLASLAIVAGLLLVLSVLIPARLPRLTFDPALTLAAVVLLYHGLLAALERAQGEGAVRVRTVLFGVGAGIVALSQMVRYLEAKRDRS